MEKQGKQNDPVCQSGWWFVEFFIFGGALLLGIEYYEKNVVN